MLKKIFKNKGKPEFGGFEEKDSPSPGLNSGGGISAGLKDKIDVKPFDINLNDIWKYDNDELVDFIHKYENYTKIILNKYHELESEQIVLRERTDLMDKERRRLLQEAEGQKIYIDNLKQSLNEHSLTETNSPLRLPTTNPNQLEKKQIEDLIKQKVKIKGIDASLLDELRLSGDKIITQLIEVKSIIDTTPDGENNDDTVNVKLQKSFKNDFLQLVDDVDLTFQLIIPKFLEVNEKLRQKEKEFTDLLKGDFLESLRQLEEGPSDKFSLDQVNELETKATEYRNKLIKTESVISELRMEISGKNEQIEKSRKWNDNLQEEAKTTKQLLNENIETSRREIEKRDKEISNLQNELKKAQEEIATSISERFNAEDVIEQAKEGFKAEQAAKDKSNEELSSIVESLSGALETISKEKENLQKKLSDLEQDKIDVENKLIQEKLKHHQTMGDLQKAKETCEQSQKDLNEEIDNRKSDVKKIEELKRIQADYDKKLKEYKKSIKRLSQQILDLQAQAISDSNKDKETTASEVTEEQSPISQINQHQHQDTVDSQAVKEELNKKDHMISEQYKKINELQEELEKILQLSNNLKDENKQYKNKNEELNSQTKILQEKREKGLQEITRLTTVIDEIKAKNPSINITQQRPVIPQGFKSPLLGNQKGVQGPIKAVHSISIPATSTVSHAPKDKLSSKGPTATYLKGIKSNLNQLYKEVIMAITSEKTGGESERGGGGVGGGSRLNISGRLDSSMNEGSISENLVRIEKKVNDVMLMLHEYQESLDD